MAAIIFDLDGVLIDSEGLQYKAYCEVLATYGRKPTFDEYAEHWIAAGRGPEYAVKTWELPIAPDELRRVRSPVYHKILCAEVTLMPGVVAALERLHKLFPMAIATNSIARDVGYVVERFELQKFFRAVVSRDDYRRAKPEPDAFLTAATRLDTPARQCVVIEDAHKGILAAHRAGTHCIAVPNEWTAKNDFSLADVVLTSLDELTPELIDRVVGSH